MPDLPVEIGKGISESTVEMKSSIRLAVVLLFARLAVQAQSPTADLVILNARVFTGSSAQPWAEALSIRGDRIAAVGSTETIRAQAGPAARVIDAAGRLVIPGINDAHAHPSATPPHTTLDGPPAVVHDPPLDEVLQRVKAAAAKAPAGGWLLGEIGAKVLEDPRATRAVLDPVTAGRPLLLHGWSGHGMLLNTAAMRQLNVGEQEPDPPGGFFARMPDGRTLTGLAHEYADYIVHQRFNMLADGDAQMRAYQLVAAEAASFGITSVQAMMTGYPAEQAAPLMVAAKLPIRIRVVDFPMTPPSKWRKPVSRRASDLVTVSGTKWILDGTPIERLMYLREPYNDAPSARGRLNFSDADLRQFLTRTMAAGEQPMFHAPGDATIDMLLDALEATGGEKWTRLRPRIEHGDMLQAAHFDRAKRMGVVIVQNPSHFMIGSLIHERLGARRSQYVAVKTIVGAGVPFALGSDGPMNPFLNMMFAAINDVNSAETLSIEQSLVAYTRGSAAAEMMEKEKGTLAPGMLADLAMLSQDIFKVPLPELPKTTSVLTIVGGRVVHERK
jgi:predicted amidohydrolase YtcJ